MKCEVPSYLWGYHSAHYKHLLCHDHMVNRKDSHPKTRHMGSTLVISCMPLCKCPDLSGLHLLICHTAPQVHSMKLHRAVLRLK